MTEVIMPALEMGQETGKLISWLRQEGERVTKGQPLIEIETDKTVVSIEASGDGLLTDIRARPGDVVQVGNVIAYLLEEGEIQPPADKPEEIAVAADIPAPSVRGEPRYEDSGVEKARRSRTLPIDRNSGHVINSIHVDMSRILSLMDDPSSETELSSLAILFAARVLKKHPGINAHVTPNEVREWDEIHIGFSAAGGTGTIIPVIRHADRKSMSQVRSEFVDLTRGAREGTLRADEMKGATFTLLTPGPYGFEDSIPLPNAPEAAVLTVGAFRELLSGGTKSTPVNPPVRLTLVADPRAVDESDAVGFLAELKDALEDPYFLLL